MKHSFLAVFAALIAQSALATEPTPGPAILLKECSSLPSGGVSTQVVRATRVCFADIKGSANEALVIATNDDSDPTVWSAVSQETRTDGALNVRFVYIGLAFEGELVASRVPLDLAASFTARRSLRAPGRTVSLTGRTPGNLQIDAHQFRVVRPSH